MLWFFLSLLPSLFTVQLSDLYIMIGNTIVYRWSLHAWISWFLHSCHSKTQSSSQFVTAFSIWIENSTDDNKFKCVNIFCYSLLFFLLLLSFIPAISASSFTFIRGGFKSLLLFDNNMGLSGYLKSLIFLQPVFTAPSSGSNPAFCVVCSVCRLNR